jgi:hypothetical protein
VWTTAGGQRLLSEVFLRISAMLLNKDFAQIRLQHAIRAELIREAAQRIQPKTSVLVRIAQSERELEKLRRSHGLPAYGTNARQTAAQSD